MAHEPTHAPSRPLLSVSNLRVTFPGRPHWRGPGRDVVAVEGVSLDVGRAETLGLVGESGCGKSTVGRAILRLLPTQARVEGSVEFDGLNVADLPPGRLRAWRRRAQIIFQDPGGSLNPRMKVGEIVAEPLRVHGTASPGDIPRRVTQLLDRCGLLASAAARYPHEFSGGQKQRIAIARAIALEPELIICDEPTSALDVSIQAQILNLLKDLQAEKSLSYLFISHDIAVVNHFCDRVAVMQEGRIVEYGPCASVLHAPIHDYSRTLLSAVPGVHRAAR